MLGMKPTRVATAVAVSLFVGCGAGAPPSREDEAAKLKAKLHFAEAASCLSQATQKECEPGLEAAFEQGGAPKAGLPVAGLIRCEGGRRSSRAMGYPRRIPAGLCSPSRVVATPPAAESSHETAAAS